MIIPTNLLPNDDTDNTVVEPVYYQSPEFIFELNPQLKILNIYILSVITSRMSAYVPLLTSIMSVGEGFETHVWLNTPGGSLQTTYTIASALKASKSKLYTHNLAMAASCGSFLLCLGEVIDVAQYSSTMFHNAAMGAQGDVSVGKQQFTFCIKEVESLFAIFVENGIITEDELTKIINGREYYFTKEQMDQRLKVAKRLPKIGG